MKTYQFPLPSQPHIVYVKDRARNSGLTSLRFFGNDRIVCCDFNGKVMYLAELTDSVPRIIASTPTIIQDGTPVQTDLMDVNKDGLIVVSNFYQGSQSFYQIEGDKLRFLEELNLHPSFFGCHGVRFIPGYADLIFVTYCGKSNKCITILDYKKRTVVHEIPMPEQMQDAAFVGPYIFAPARTDHITLGGPNTTKMYATIYLFRMPDNLYVNAPKLVDTWHGEGHLDAMIEYGDQVYSANQYTDKIDVFGITPEERIEKRSSINGFLMPHGLDIRHDGLMAVTNYQDSSLRLVELAPIAA